MHAAGIAALGLVHGEEALDLGQDAVERPRLVAVGDVMVLPCMGSQHHTTLRALALDRADQRRQLGLDLVGAHAGDEGQPPRLVLGVEDVDQPQQIVGLELRARISARSGS